jgi:transposase-like protein
MDMSARRSYTNEQRTAAVADVSTLGVREAARKHHVPESCMSRWAKAAGVRRGDAATPAPLPAPEQKHAAPPREANGAARRAW